MSPIHLSPMQATIARPSFQRRRGEQGLLTGVREYRKQVSKFQVSSTLGSEAFMDEFYSLEKDDYGDCCDDQEHAQSDIDSNIRVWSAGHLRWGSRFFPIIPE